MVANTEMILRLLLAAVLGGAVGFEREITKRRLVLGLIS